MRKIFALVPLLFTVPAYAQLYGGANLTVVAYAEDGFSTAHPIAATFKLGNHLASNLAVEGRLAVGLTDDSASGCVDTGAGIVCGTADIEVDYYYGAYFKALLPAGVVLPYAILGFTKAELTASAGGQSVSGDDSDVSFGVGIDFAPGGPTGFNVEIMRLLDGPGFDVTALSAGVVFRF